ncbi:MAG: protein kinase [Myxococcota bacterium]|nr:protein kinase [Myxococcota bacterium]
MPVHGFEGSERSRPRLRTIPSLPRVGDIIAGKYELARVIGEGGMGVVYEATHVRLRQRLAIKVLRPEVPEFGEVVARFEREARAAARLQSIHTARVIDVDTLPGGLPYIVLEFLEGRDLDAELAATGPMPVEEAADIVMQVADAMGEAHALGIVHRDLKPSNLFVCRIGEHDRRIVKVLDFGISKSESEDKRLTPSHAYFGTPYYAAPEQLRAATAADARSDVWSLGAILFELLTGRTPFVGTPTAVITKVVSDPVPWVTELRPELPRELARIVMRALQRDPQQRFQSMQELAQAMEPFGPKQTLAQAVADAPRGKGKLGEILIADGLLSTADLARALDEQRRSGKLLGRVLLDLRLVSQVDLLTALAKQQGVIVTPEAPSPSERERSQREARTDSPSLSPPRPWWRQAWIAAVLIGLPLGVAGALWLVSMKSRPATAGIVGAISPPPSAAVVALIPPPSAAAPTASSTAVPTAGTAPSKSVRPATPARAAAPRERQSFEPSGI